MDNVLRNGLVPGTKCFISNANGVGVSISPYSTEEKPFV